MLTVSYSDISNGTVVLLTIIGCAADLDLRTISPAGGWQLSIIVMMIGWSLWRRLPWADFFEGFGDHRSRDGQAAVVNFYIQPWPDQQQAALEALLIVPDGRLRRTVILCVGCLPQNISGLICRSKPCRFLLKFIWARMIFSFAHEVAPIEAKITKRRRTLMRISSDHILTSHAGSLPRPDALIEANRAREAGEEIEEVAFQATLRDAVGEVVRRQHHLGIDVPNDGEFGKSMAHRVNYGAWWGYAFHRLGGIEFGAPGTYGVKPRRSRPGEIVLTSQDDRRDRQRFAAAYADRESGVYMGPRPATGPVVTAKLSYIGHEALAADIDNFKAALAVVGIDEGFMTAVAPGTAYRIGNAFYEEDEQFLYDCAEAMREEYKAIVDAGLILQLDDPSTATGWDMINPEPRLKDYKKFTMVRIEALNHALRGLPPERIRYHLCWGSWHGPHMTDIPMRDIVECMLAVNAGAYSFEAGNVRHEHEWKVWQDVKLPDGKLILPGVVSHATNVVEHPELVCDRIFRFANLVGRERVIASTDCGLGGRIHPQIAWAKLETLAHGAALATKQLWR